MPDASAIPATMRTLVITENSASPSARSIASPRTCASISKSHASGSPPIRRRLLKHLQSCVILLFGLLLCVLFVAFALCTVEGSMHIAAKRSLEDGKFFRYYGRTLMQEPDNRGYRPPTQIQKEDMSTIATPPHLSNNETALHGLGSVYMRGTKTMPNLIIANLDESCDILDLRLFLRTLYKSGTMASSDLIFLFPWPFMPLSYLNILREESDYFTKFHASSANIAAHSGGMDSFRDSGEIIERKNGNNMNLNRRGQTFWGINPISQENQERTTLFDPDYGSVVGFSMHDLDPSDMFSEFISSPSPQLRRWLCYEMLLGLLKFKFRLVMLVELGGVVVLGDVFARAKRKDFLYLTLEDSTWGDMPAEFDHVLLRGRSSSDGLPGVVKGSRNMFDNKRIARGTVKRRSECKRCSRARQRNRPSLSHAEDPELSNERKGFTEGDNGILIRSAPELTVFSGEQQGLMETVYGREVWNGLEQVERQRRVISSRVILSSMRAARGLASSMSVEIVRVALQRSSQLSFPDRAVISYLVQKSPHLLGRRVVDNLQLMENSNSKIHSVENMKPDDVLVRSRNVQNYNVLHASSLNMQRSDFFQSQQHESMQNNATASVLILANICASIKNASDFYPDCDHEQVQLP